ncbi:MAG: hypothetical protein ACYC6C_11575, partial [Coriobacteriia bacterium]
MRSLTTCGVMAPSRMRATLLFTTLFATSVTLALARDAASTAPPSLPSPAAVTPAQADAQWAQAVALETGRFPIAAAVAFGRIAQNPLHPRSHDAVVALSRLTRQVPGGADLERFFATESPQLIASIPNPVKRSAASFLLGKQRYTAGDHAGAIGALQAVLEADPLRAHALLLAGAAHVRMHKSAPAIQAFRMSLASLDAGAPRRDRPYMRDVALAAIARTFVNAAVRPNDEGRLQVDATRLSAAVKYMKLVDPSSPLWPDIAFELAWAYFFAGDYVRADGFSRALTQSAFPD